MTDENKSDEKRFTGLGGALGGAIGTWVGPSLGGGIGSSLEDENRRSALLELLESARNDDHAEPVKDAEPGLYARADIFRGAVASYLAANPDEAVRKLLTDAVTLIDELEEETKA